MKEAKLFTAAILAVGSLTYVGCDRSETATSSGTSSTPSSTQPTVGDSVERGMENAGDALGRAADKTVEVSKDAGRAVANAADKAGDKIADATHRTAEETKDAADRAGDRVGDAANRAGQRTGEVAAGAAAGARDAAHDTAEGARDATDDARVASGQIGKGTAAAPDAEGIRDILASVTEAALTENGLNDLTERLVDADRNRIGEGIGQASPEHAALVKQFRADWKAKYGQEFDIQNEERVFPDTMFTVAQSEIGAAAPSGAAVATGQRAGDVDTNREAGRNIATVQVKASHGMPGLSVPLMHELPDNWRIDAPDTITAAKLRSNVLAHLKAAHAMKAQWPANVDDAYAAVSHHVLMAILDKPLSK